MTKLSSRNTSPKPMGQAMTPETQRIAIAEACGRDGGCVKRSLERFKGRDGYPDAIFQIGKIPDYLNDLNAMHEAETQVLNKNVRFYLSYGQNLTAMCGGSIDALFATAAQRAEAFLRTLNLWKDDV